jgi:WD40 repeat protein
MSAVGFSSAFADRMSLFGGSSSSSSGGIAGDAYSDGYGSCGLLLAGTADGHVCCLDVETGALVEDLVACWEPRQPRSAAAAAAAATAGLGYYSQQQHLAQQQLQQQPHMSPLLLAGGTGTAGWEDPSSCVISAVCSSNRGASGSGGWLAAGSGSGRLLLLDSRAGLVLGSWQAHTQRVNQLQGLAGARGDWQLLSCSQDRTLKLWDLRMLRQTRHWSGSSSSSGVPGSLPVAAFKGTKDGIEGFVVYQDAAIVYGGANVGLAPLDSSSVPSNQQQQQQQGWSAPAAAVMRHVRMTGIRGGSTRGLGSSGKASREGLGPKGASSGSAIIGLGLLPHSKLLVVGSKDGQLKVCR